jgi:hypothetical protein
MQEAPRCNTKGLRAHSQMDDSRLETRARSFELELRTGVLARHLLLVSGKPLTIEVRGIPRAIADRDEFRLDTGVDTLENCDGRNLFDTGSCRIADHTVPDHREPGRPEEVRVPERKRVPGDLPTRGTLMRSRLVEVSLKSRADGQCAFTHVDEELIDLFTGQGNFDAREQELAPRREFAPCHHEDGVEGKNKLPPRRDREDRDLIRPVLADGLRTIFFEVHRDVDLLGTSREGCHDEGGESGQGRLHLGEVLLEETSTDNELVHRILLY